MSNTVTYTITVNNMSGSLFQSGTFPAFLTNDFSGPVQWTGFSISSANPSVYFWSSNANSELVFNLGTFPSGNAIQLSVTAQPTGLGSITNVISAAAPFSSFTTTNYVITNVVSTVTNALFPTNVSADLAISLSGPLSSVITNDWMTYGITVTNLGTNDASNVILSNMLPAGVRYISVWPSTLTPTETDSNVVINLGTISNATAGFLALRVQPANAGVLPFTAVVGSQNVPDPNPTNNVATTNIVVTNFLSGLLAVSLVDATQQFNPQTGLLEQRVSLSNVDTNSIDFARVTVLGLTNWLFNAAGTNNGNPFVVYANTLTNGDSVELRLEYFNPFGSPVPFSGLQANQVPFVSLAPPFPLGTQVNSTNVSVFDLANGDVMVEWTQAFTNRGYTILYYDNGASNNVMTAMPSYPSPANVAQWIDYGPPKTISLPPTNRAYGVFLNP